MRERGPRVALLAIGLFTPATAKTAIGVLRYARYPVVAVIDPDRAGTDASLARTASSLCCAPFARGCGRS
ncbi:MAG: hypothetical protein KGQ88_01535, partial [Chloroflexi bacterium]|nr:hypothetical protein [Chloroflexota bacterium]